MSKKRWEDETLKPTLDKYPERKETLLDERDILDTPEDVNESEMELPGKYPYTRGIHATGYRGRLWTMRQYAGFSDAKSTNKRFLDLLENGQSGLSVAFDLPTQLGLNSNSELAEGNLLDPFIFNITLKVNVSSDLSEGWNWISFNVFDNDMSLASMLSSVSDNVSNLFL